MEVRYTKHTIVTQDVDGKQHVTDLNKHFVPKHWRICGQSIIEWLHDESDMQQQIIKITITAWQRQQETVK